MKDLILVKFLYLIDLEEKEKKNTDEISLNINLRKKKL